MLSARFIIIALLLCGAAACSSKSKEEPEPKEIPISENMDSDSSQEDLIESAKHYYEVGLYSIAQEKFESLRDSYPLGPYAEFAELKAADSYFAEREYQTAALLYENFVKDHPASRACAYATKKAARSYQLANKGLGRDMTSLQKSLKFYDKLLTDYPDSIYCADALKYKKEVVSEIIANEELIIDYYRKRDAARSAQARQKELEDTWVPVLKAVQAQEQELSGRTYAYIASANKETAVLSASPVELESDNLSEADLNQISTGPAVVPQSPVKTEEIAGLQPPVQARSKRIANILQGIRCKDADRRTVLLHAKSIAPLERIEQRLGGKHLDPKGGYITIDLPELISEDLSKDCFAISDLRLTSDGYFKLRTDSGASLMILQNPPRLMLLLE